MQEIRAYIKPFMLDELALALMDIDQFPGFSVMSVRGFGKKRYESQQAFDPFVERLRIEIISPEALVEPIVQTILHHAHSGKVGDGKVYVSPVSRAFDIRTQQEES